MSENWFDLTGKTAVVTGGYGVLCSSISKFLAEHGANIALLDRRVGSGDECVEEIGERTIGLYVDVLERDTLEAAAAQIKERFGPADILINGAGGNRESATSNAAHSFFDLEPDALKWVFDLNFLGTVLPSQVFGRQMAEKGSGTIINISSMSAFRPLTRVAAYSAAKAAVSNFTQWLAVYMAQEYGAGLRVNAIAPGFFITEQNRYLLTDEKTGELTTRGQQVLAQSPMGRFGNPEDLHGTVLWLVSPASAFVTGVVVPIDGGFNAYAGV